MASTFDEAFAAVQSLAKDFDAQKDFYLSPKYQEAEARRDFIDKFLIALGWDVNHDKQKNPYEQEVKVERKEHGVSQRRADYAFYLAPNFRDVKFYIEAKKPFGDIATPDNYFQTIRYGWSSKTKIAALFDFEQFEIVDCRFKPDLKTALQRNLKRFKYTEYADPEKFAEIYWLFPARQLPTGRWKNTRRRCQKAVARCNAATLMILFSKTWTPIAIRSRTFSKTVIPNSTAKPCGFNKELQQGHREWLDEKRFLKSNSERPCSKKRRIATQRITGVDERLRIVAAIMDAPAYFADSTNSIVIKDGSPYRLEYLLGLLNSKLFQWRFKLTSSNNNVGTNELESMPFCKINFDDLADKAQHTRMVSLVEQMLAAKPQLARAQSDKDKDFYENKCAALDRQIDVLVYDLYGLTPDEIKIVEGAAK